VVAQKTPEPFPLIFSPFPFFFTDRKFLWRASLGEGVRERVFLATAFLQSNLPRNVKQYGLTLFWPLGERRGAIGTSVTHYLRTSVTLLMLCLGSLWRSSCSWLSGPSLRAGRPRRGDAKRQVRSEAKAPSRSFRFFLGLGGMGSPGTFLRTDDARSWAIRIVEAVFKVTDMEVGVMQFRDSVSVLEDAH